MNKIALSDMSLTSALFSNDMKYLHWTSIGPEFDTQHAIASALYDYSAEMADYFAEKALSQNLEIYNISTAAQTPVGEVWSIQHKESGEGYDWDAFTSTLEELGSDLVEALEICREDKDADIQSKIDEFVDYITRECVYKNQQRQK